MTTHFRTCPLCEAMCGLEIETEGDRVVRVRGDREDVWSRGFLCPKGAGLGELHHRPDRLRAPLVKGADGRHHEVTWDEAFGRCEELLHPILAEDGIGAVTAYLGNPNVHSYSLHRYSGAIPGLPQMPVTWSAGTVDQWPKNLACAQVFGGAWTIPIPDVANTDLLVIMGANPQASNGSLLSYPDLIGELARIRDRGGRTIVVDPRRTGTAAKADEWLPIVPGTDAALLLAVVAALEDEGLVRLGPLEGRVRGVDEVLAAARPFIPEHVAPWCGIEPERIRALARELAATPRAVVYGRIGLCTQEFGTLASWLVDVVNILTGHQDVEGGARFPRPAIVPISATARRRGPVRSGRWRTRVRSAPEVLGQAPLSCLAEEIATPGPGRTRALITIAGNPVLSAPDAGRLEEALPLLDAMISIDLFLNETTRHANVVLPGLSPLEQPHMDEALWAFALRGVARWSPPIFEPGDRPAEWEIALRLGAILSGTPAAEVDVEALDDLWFAARATRHGISPADVDTGRLRGPDRIADLTVRLGPWGDGYGANPDGLTLEKLRSLPHGIDFGPSHTPTVELLRTASGDVELAHDTFFDDLARLRRRMAEPRPPLVLIGRRHVQTNNSWIHGGKRRRTQLLVHPDDAARYGLRDGQRANAATEAGAVVVSVQVTDEIRPGVVSLPHGWDSPNTNLLVPGAFLDEPSGNAAVNGVPVELTPA